MQVFEQIIMQLRAGLHDSAASDYADMMKISLVESKDVLRPWIVILKGVQLPKTGPRRKKKE